MIKKREGLDMIKQPDPKRKDEAKRQLNTKAVNSENQCLLWKFNKDHPGLPFDEAGMILTFVHWLEDNDYIIFDAKGMMGSEEIKNEIKNRDKARLQ